LPFFTFKRTVNLNEWKWHGNREKCRKRKVFSPYMTWLRSAAAAVEKAGSLEQALSARDLIE